MASTAAMPVAAKQTQQPAKSILSTNEQQDQQWIQQLIASTETSAAHQVDTLQLVSSLQLVYNSGRLPGLLVRLDEFAQKRAQEIESICHDHYQSFVQSVEALSQVRAEAKRLKEHWVTLNEMVQERGQNLLKQETQLLECQKMAQNMEQTTEQFQVCLRVLHLAQKVKTELENKKFFAALRTLDSLETRYLKPLSHYSFAKQLQSSIPIWRDAVKSQVLTELQDWLAWVRAKAHALGQLALSTTPPSNSHAPIVIAGSPRMRQNSRLDESIPDESKTEVDSIYLLEHDSVQIQFQPLYQSLHIMNRLNRREALLAQFEEDRRVQCNLMLQEQVGNDAVSCLENLMTRVLGYFIFEFYLLASAQPCRSRGKVDQLWQQTLETIQKRAIRDLLLQNLDDTALFVRVRQCIVSFSRTAQRFGYESRILTEALLGVFQHYIESSRESTLSQLSNQIDEDDLRPIQLDTEEDLSKMQNRFAFLKNEKYDKGGLDTWPRVLPFSQSIILGLDLIFQFIDDFYKFVADLSQSSNEAVIDALAKKSVDALLEHWRQRLMRRVETGRADSLSDLAMLVIHFECLELICQEDLVPRLSHWCLSRCRRWTRNGLEWESVQVHLPSTELFIQSRKSTEYRIFELVNATVDDVLRTAHYDWCPSKLLGKPSDFLQQLVTFLKEVWQSDLALLPASIKTFILFDAFNHLATSLLTLLATAKKVNYIFVESFNLDVTFLESFVAGFHESNLDDTFLELRELVDLMRSDQLQDFVDPAVRRKKLTRLKPSFAVQMLEKLRDAPSLKDPKAKRKSIDLLIKTLSETSPTRK